VTPLDLTADWMHREVPCLSLDQCKRLVMATVTRREQFMVFARPLTEMSITEQRLLMAWDRNVREWREGGAA
jgi:type IV secretory pathway ATPase VirB11/archaellum biosynthesis ATPase